MLATPTKTIRHGDGPKKDVAIVQNGVVVNKISVPEEWTAKEWARHVPEDCTAHEHEACMIGDTFDGRSFKRKVIWNDKAGNAIPDFEINVDSPLSALPASSWNPSPYRHAHRLQ